MFPFKLSEREHFYKPFAKTAKNRCFYINANVEELTPKKRSENIGYYSQAAERYGAD
jgi:hypothetical protein|nr:MAG TPA: hypothetical protein [Caudoviricetes sp.]